MKRLWTAACFAVFSILTQAALSSQTLPSVAAFAIGTTDADGYVTKTVNDLVFSFILEMRSYRVNDLRTESLPTDLSVPAGIDYLFYGSLSQQPNGVRLELVLRGGPLDITRKISRVFENTNRVLLESRMLVRDLFDLNISLPDPVAGHQVASGPGPQTSLPSIDSLSGTWSGESGVEKIMILRGGRGIMILTSGVSISLTLEYQDSLLVIRQKGALNPRQFLDLPEKVAKEASQTLQPPEWDMAPGQDKNVLTGVKKTAKVTHNGDAIVDIVPEEVPIEWRRL